uniref:Cation/H+ exchanger domain-containing protein n=1 Tax=Virgibacillus oceani TaxID=1479511 RepID=A0A917HFG1_9BACI|nr:hypothetical protein GCM10011398_23340 [Virgibacillus oceani]
MIIVTLGLETHLLPQDIFAVNIVICLVITIVTPPMMKWFLISNELPIRICRRYVEHTKDIFSPYSKRC